MPAGARIGSQIIEDNTKISGSDDAVAPLVTDLRQLIAATRERVALTVNAELTMLYWHIGQRIRTEILKEERAEYGQRLIEGVAKELSREFGGGFGRRNVFRMVRLAELFVDEAIVSTLSTQLSWSHFLEILQINDELSRKFYAEMCRLERWSVRTLRDRVNGMLYERTALSKKPEELIARELSALGDADKLTPDLVFRDPYLLDFLGLWDAYSEKDHSAAILREMERFLLEFGTHFTFVARNKRIIVDGEDHEIDLLLFHRALRRLVVIELKIGTLQAAHKGQTELYLRWLDLHERLPHEEEPLGLILCTQAGPEQVALLSLDSGSIRVAEYLTVLPPRALLEAKLAEESPVAASKSRVVAASDFGLPTSFRQTLLSPDDPFNTIGIEQSTLAPVGTDANFRKTCLPTRISQEIKQKTGIFTIRKRGAWLYHLRGSTLDVSISA